MGRPAALLLKVDQAKATQEKANAHLSDARRRYRRACYDAYEGGVNVTQLAAHVGTSWSRMNQILKQAKAELRGLKTLAK